MRIARFVMVALVGIMLAVCGCTQNKFARMDKDEYMDKCKGAWAGQMIGVAWAGPYEFYSRGEPILEELRPWSEECYHRVLDQDDLYVELNFLKALELYGPDITYEQAGQVFGRFDARLWHANLFGRENIRYGIMPPASGHPKNNRHADDIDFQIEADLLGIICPGMPVTSNKLGDVFGHIMNYGDGVYGGLFVAGMYTEAYFSKDIDQVIEAGLACIPEESQYHKCISDVIAWHEEHPDDWLKVWQKIEDKWQDDIDCAVGRPYNIDAKLNGAYIVMGMLYGEGDFYKTMEVSVRCGQDADCNPSNAAGILGCMYGFEALDDKYTDPIADFADEDFNFTEYSFNEALAASQRMTETIIKQEGGKVTEDAYLIRRQEPEPAPLEQWDNQMEILAEAIPYSELRLWNPGWKVIACNRQYTPGLRNKVDGRPNILIIQPIGPNEPAAISSNLLVPNVQDPTLFVDVASYPKGSCKFKIFVDDQLEHESVIDSKGKWVTRKVDLDKAHDKHVKVRLEVHGDGSRESLAYLDRVEIK
jgi:hypothetical protein